MPWGLIAPEKRCKASHTRHQRKRATREHPCAVVCGRKIAIGDFMQFVRPVDDPEDFTAMHAECWDALPEHAAEAPDPDVQEVYASGQRERANGVAEHLCAEGQDAWAEMLPPARRSLGRRYVVFAREQQKGQLALIREGS